MPINYKRTKNFLQAGEPGLLLIAIFVLVWTGFARAQIYPSADGVKLPNAYFEQIQKDPASFQLTRSLIRYADRIRQNREAYLRGEISLEEAELRGGIRVAGSRDIPVLTGKFANTGADPYPVSDLQTELFDGPWPSGTMTQFYSEISYNNLTVSGTVFNWHTVLQNDSYYEGTCNGLGPSCSKTGEFLKEVLDGNDPAIDFGQYDNDGPDGIPNSGDDDGYVDFVAFVHPESGGECGNSNIWSHRWVYSAWWGSSYTTNDPRTGGGNIKINDYVIQPALACNNVTMIQIGVFCHEFGHAFGLPDLYDTDGSSEGVGHWGLMGSGSWNTPSSPAHMSAWSKEQLGWIVPTVITAPPGKNAGEFVYEILATETINNVEFNAQALKLWTNGNPLNEYFLVTNRQALGFDANVHNSGLLIWHIDNNQSNNRNEWYPGLNPAFHYKVALEQADGNWDLEHNDNRGDAGDPFPGTTNNTNFNATSVPNSDAYTLGPSMVAVESISPSGDPMTADISVGGVQAADVLIWKHTDVSDPNIAEKARSRGLSEAEVESMVKQPTSHLALAAALQANGKTVLTVSEITSVNLTDFEAVFAVVGIYPNNHVIPANSAEATAIDNYINGGGKVYMEGGEVWYYDPQSAGGHDFGPLFGINGLSDGSGDLSTVLGVSGTFTEGLDYNYSGDNNFIDQLQPTATGFTVHQNASPSYDCGVANSTSGYHTIGASFQFGGLDDGASTKNQLMAEYLGFFGIPGGGGPPDIEVSPLSFDVALPPGGTTTEILTIGNVGAGALEFDIADQELSGMANVAKKMDGIVSIDYGSNKFDFVTVKEAGGYKATNSLSISSNVDDSNGDGLSDQIEPPIGKYPPYSINASIGMIQTADYNYPYERLSGLGFTDITLISPNSNLADFVNYDVIYLPEGWAQAGGDYDVIESHSADYISYISGGGGFFSDQPNPYQQPGEQITPSILPYPITFYNLYDPNDWPPIIVNPNHDITIGLSPEEMPFPADQMISLAQEYEILVKGAVTNSPSLVLASYGAGKVLVQTAHPSENANHPFSDEVYSRMVHWVTGNDAPWLSENPTSGTLPSGESMPIDVIFDATSLSPGDYFAEILITSNDPDEPVVTVPVTLNVEPPDITVDPLSFEVTLPPCGTTTEIMTIGNVGGSQLDFNIVEALANLTVPEINPQDLDEAGNVDPLPPTDPYDLGDVINSFPSPAGGDPHGLAWKDEHLWTIVHDLSRIYELDPTDGVVISTLDIAVGSPFGLAWDGQYFWVDDPGADVIHKIDPSTGASLFSFPSPGDGPVGLAWDGTYLWNTNWTLDMIYKIDPTDGSVVQQFPAPDTRSAGAAFDGNYLWVNGRDSALTYKIDPSNGVVVASFPTPPAPGGNNGQGAAFDGQYLWVGNYDLLMIYQVDIELATDVVCWLDVNPKSGTVNSGEETILDVTINAFCGSTCLEPGAYSAQILINSNDPDEPVVIVPVTLNVQTDAIIWIPDDVIEPNVQKKAAERNLSVQTVQNMLITPNSHNELKAALEANGKTARITNTLTAGDLTDVSYLFAVLGIFPNNHVVKATDPEAAIIENFIAAGGKVYIEGGDLWYYDPQALGGHDFGPTFSIDAQEDGANDLKTVKGSNVAAGKDFTYSGQNNFIDHLAPLAPAVTIHSNDSPAYDCGVAYDSPAGYRTIGTSYEFGGLDDASISGSSKAALMASYLGFFDTGLALATAGFDFPLQNGGWYLVALPVVPEDVSVSALFPNAVAAFGWDYATQGYVAVTEFAPAQGYWLAMSSAATVEVTGVPFLSYNKSYTSSGWDMIGSVMSESSMQSQPNGNVFAMFGYNALTGQYESVRNFEPKQGYWIAVTASEQEPLFITVGSTTASSMASAKSGDLLAAFGSSPPMPPQFAIEGEELVAIPSEYGLLQNYPNPFNPVTVITYQLPEPGHVSLKIYTILGREVQTLVDGEMPAGIHRVKWDARNGAGQRVESGVYIYRLQAVDFVQTKKLILVK